MAADPADDRWMSLALALGRRGMGRTWPNPAVGCVIVRGGRILGRGWTRPGGRPHAETVALAQAGPAARGATAYVTLEPCAHSGKTPPCATALLTAGIARVVTAITDPDTRVCGKGHAALRAAGIALTTGVLAAEATADHAGFLLAKTADRPFVTLKLATSLDGRIATRSGESQWITGPEARRLVHRMRATHDAVMVGAGTARADDPSLTVRGIGEIQQPLRIICDSRLTSSPDCILGRTARKIPVWLCHTDAAPPANRAPWLACGAHLVACKATTNGQIDMPDMVRRLADLGLTRVFCEGGGQLAASLLTADLIDQLISFTAGLTLGASAIPSVGALPDRPLAAYRRFKLADSRMIGADRVDFWHRS